jgi:predicted transcriptional regulator
MYDPAHEDVTHLELLGMMSDIVSAHVEKNAVSAADLPRLLQAVFSTLKGLGASVAVMAPEELKPAVPVRRSVMHDHIVCLEDGKKLKMLKRHLRTAFNMTPDEYRRRWGLPPDYPMVAPDYAARRRELAVKIGLGTRREVIVKTTRRKASETA